MSFLGLFKSKQEKDMEKIQSKMYSNIFPGGREQSEREIQEVDELLGSKYSKNQLAGAYIHMASLFFISEDKSEERIVGSAMIRANGEITKEDILKIYNYIKDQSIKVLLNKIQEEKECIQKEFEEYYSKGLDKVFSGGNEQIEKEVDEVVELIGNNDYSREQIKEYYIMRTRSFFNSKEEDIETRDISRKAEIINMNKLEELKILSYLTKKRHKLKKEYEKPFMDGMFGGWDNSDEIPGGQGAFGFSVNNPIPTNGVTGSNTYLGRLRLPDDNKIKWERTGTCSSKNIENIIDEYKLFDLSDNFIATIYISLYHKKNSNKSPAGFELS